MAARKFLWIFAILIFVVVGGGILYKMFEPQLMRFAFVPRMSFAESKPAAAPDYDAKSGWLARPDIAGNPSFWTPKGYFHADKPEVSVFYVTPTTYLDNAAWNDPGDDQRSNDFRKRVVKGQATAFTSVGEVWSPNYRQAAFGAFMAPGKDATAALDFAYADVLRAFDAFVTQAPADRPIILAGHSQGSLHLLRLLRERVAGQPIAARIVAVYAVGWPISTTADLPTLGLPGCAKAQDEGCILSWQSFALPADPKYLAEVYDSGVGFTGLPRKGTPMLCVNPLNGFERGTQPKEANLGALVPSGDGGEPTLEAARVPAKCQPQGLLTIGEPPFGFGQMVLPGNNYHVWDYSLFWANIRVDVERRLKSWQAAHPR